MTAATTKNEVRTTQGSRVPLVHGRKFDSLFVYAVAYLAFLYIPILFIPLFSFNDSIYVAFPIKGLTFDHYAAMAAQEPLIDALLNSLKVGAIVAVTATVLGTLAAKAITRYKLRGGGAVVGFIMFPFVIPGIILGISLLVLAKQAGVPLSLFTIGISHVLIATPFAMLVMISRLEGFDKNLEEASLDLGENAWMTFWRVTFRLALPGFIACLLLTFTESFDEFILAFFLAGNEPTLPVYIWSQLRFPSKLPNVLALGACVIAVSFFVVAFSEWVRRRGVQPDKQSQVVG